MTQHHDQGNLQKKVFNLAYCFRGLASMMAKKRLSRRNGWEFISWFTSRWPGGNTRNGLILLKSQSHLQGHTSSNKATSSNPFQTVPALGDETVIRAYRGHCHSSHCTRYKASCTHMYEWQDPPPLSSPILPMSSHSEKPVHLKVSTPKDLKLWKYQRVGHY